MTRRFFDTSAAVKYYRTELGTPIIDAFLSEAEATHFISALSIVEFYSTLTRLTRTALIPMGDFHLAQGRFLADIANGLWKVTPTNEVHYHSAQRLLVKHGFKHSLRTLDAIQLAIACDLNAGESLDALICADANLCRIAKAEGLVVVNPETIQNMPT